MKSNLPLVLLLLTVLLELWEIFGLDHVNVSLNADSAEMPESFVHERDFSHVSPLLVENHITELQ